MASVRIIKRYANRKFYDTQTSSYVTLQELGEWWRSGVKIQVVDHASGQDLTAVTLEQIPFEAEKSNRSTLLNQALGTIRKITQLYSDVKALSLRLENLENRVTKMERQKSKKAESANQVAMNA